IAGAIDKYVYVSVLRPFTEGIFLKYSHIENAKGIEEIKHPIIREALLMQGLKTPQIEITTLADIPAGTGLGSSGSFTTALLRALYAHRKQHILSGNLAEMACHIEIDRLGEPVGKQDQYIAAFGGLTAFTFHKDDSVTSEPIKIPIETVFNLEDSLLLFFTGFSRSAGSILSDQHQRSQRNDSQMLDNLHYTKDLGYRSRDALESGDLKKFGKLMDEHWQRKRARSLGMSNDEIDSWYRLAMDNGAIGGKLVGAGGGGFLMFLAGDAALLRSAMHLAGLEEARFRFDYEGTKVLLS
ncbi:MAG: GHMP kinase, partial [Synergistaceae bacterium]|nr:GHMP kinase [Synergistaceae bacterium]